MLGVARGVRYHAIQEAPVQALEAADGRSVPESLWQAVPCPNYSGDEEVSSELVLVTFGHKIVPHRVLPGHSPLVPLFTIIRTGIHFVHHFVGLSVSCRSPFSGLQTGQAQLH